MEMCNHCYIVFNERDCPLCDAKKEIKMLEKQIEELEREAK